MTGIQGVQYEHRGIDHEDQRRTLSTIFNGDLGAFVAKQAKIAIMKQEAVLGGHYHDYDELFYLLEGSATFTLKDIVTELTQKYNLVKGDRLFIPKTVAHKATLPANTVIIGLTAEPYISAQQNDHKYEL